ncbi:MAG: hypothetical protein JXN65_02100 [Clostridia bacterium]|nr:hypothetical protein [Clostridia bacterium]
MKFRQLRNFLYYYFYPIYFIYMIFISLSLLLLIVNGVTDIFSVIALSAILILGIGLFFYIKKKGWLDRIIEISEEGIKCYTKKREILMKWDNIDIVLINPWFLPHQRFITFKSILDKEHKSYRPDPVKISEYYIAFEYTDEIIEEVKKYWKNKITCEDQYIAYKNKKRKRKKD